MFVCERISKFAICFLGNQLNFVKKQAENMFFFF